MATFIERCIQEEDFETDGGAIDLNHFKALLNFYDADSIDAAYIKNVFNTTTPQSEELDEILATRPGVLAALLVRAQWAEIVVAVMYAGYNGWTGFEDADACRTALEL